MSESNPKTRRYGLYGLLLLAGLLFYFPVFLHLDSKPLREWDEARNAINAFEMSLSGDLIVKTYKGEPDLWETKPPLLVWLQAAGFKMFGYGELAVRLPSALSAFALALFMIFWFKKVLNAPFAGLVAGLILLTSDGFIHDHAARTGDHDAMLCLFAMMMLAAFHSFAETGKTKSLILTVTFLVLGVYTKSVAALMFLPGVLLYIILRGKLFNLLRDPRVWYALIGFAVPVAVYYLYREYRVPGYLEAVWHNELIPRYSNTSDRYSYNVSGYWYYLKELTGWQFSAWIIYVIPAVVLNFFIGKGSARSLNLFLVCNAVCYFLIISSGTSNFWYDLPLLPVLSALTGLAVYNVYRYSCEMLPEKKKLITRIGSALLILMFIKPYAGIIRKNLDTNEHSAQVMYGYAFREISSTRPELRSIHIYDPLGYNYPLVFYRMVHEYRNGMQFSDVSPDELQGFSGTLLMLDEQYGAVEKIIPAHEVLIEEQGYRLVSIP